MCSTRLRSFPQCCLLKQFQCWSDWRRSFLVLSRKIVVALPLSTPVSSSKAIDGVMSLALCPQVVSLVPQRFRSSETQAVCDGCVVFFPASLSALSFPLTLSRPLKEDRCCASSFYASLLQGDLWCDVLGFVLAGSVSSSSTLQIFRDASRLWWLPRPPVYLLCRFLWLRHVLDSPPKGCVWKVDC